MQNGTIALVTGANKGIGREIARQLGAQGCVVWIGARDIAQGTEAADALRAEGNDPRCVQLDVTDEASIERAAAAIAAQTGYLDILVNNAGIRDRDDGPPSSTHLDAVRRIFDTNFFGALAVTQAMLPLLLKSRSARIVNISSGLGSLALNADPTWEFAAVKRMGYNTSKAALNMLTVQLAAELKETGIKVNSAAPGFTATDGNGHRGHQTVAQGAAAAVRLALLPEDGPTGGFFSADQQQPW